MNVGDRNGMMEVTLINEDGTYQAVCDCGVVNKYKVGRVLKSRCRECNTKVASQANQPHSKCDLVVRKYSDEELELMKEFQDEK